MKKLNQKEWIAVSVALFVIGFFFLFGENVLRVAARSAVGTNNVKKMDTPEILIQDSVVGTGQEALPGRQVTVEYTGKFTNGKVFDTSSGRGPFTFVLGAGQVIQGWDRGVMGMKVGGKRTLMIPPEFGYGQNDYGPIPGGSTLIFDVELLKVE
jgi:FKBP-type peptidyl-prolyl cis-trans isomerase FkpA